MADINKLIPIIKKYEGGYVNHPNDKGGCTNSGVTIATYQYYFGKNKTCEDLKKITENEWLTIFRFGYWNRFKADRINNQSIANLLVDWVYMSGVNAIKKAQAQLGVKTDGVVGEVTLKAINNYPNQQELFNKLWTRRKKFFDDIVRRNPSQQVFYKGWMNRLKNYRFSE